MLTILPTLEERIACKSCESLSFIANLYGQRVQVTVGSTLSLWRLISVEEAAKYGDEPGSECLARGPWEAIDWIMGHTKAGPERNRILEHYEWNFFPYFLQQQEVRAKAETELWEQQLQQQAAQYWERVQEQLAASQKYVPANSPAHFPVESQEPIPYAPPVPSPPVPSTPTTSPPQ